MNLREKKGCKNLAVAVQLKWKLMGQFCSIGRCFFDVVPYEKDTMPGLFRTRCVRCYVLPCISIKL